MALCTPGRVYSKKNASASGTIMSGKTFIPIVRNDVASVPVAACAPVMAGNNIGADIATAILLIIENVASRGTLPPSMPVMTGAAVAVGQNTHMNAPCAT